MKKVLILVLLPFTSLLSKECAHQTISSGVTNHTNYTIRRPFITANPEVVSGPWRGAPFKRDAPIYSAIQITPLGGQSTRPESLGRYFTFCNKNELSVGLSQQGAELPDVNPTHFNISYQTTFSSSISFRPSHSFMGIGFQWRYYPNKQHHNPTWFIDVNTAVIRVRNDMNLCEKNISVDGSLLPGSALNMTDAFKGTVPYRLSKNSAVCMEYGKISGSRKTTRLQDFELKLGYLIQCDDQMHAAMYGGYDIPTGNKPNAEYLFEAIVGNNQHGGILTGIEFGMNLYRCDEGQIWWELNGATRYLIRNFQRRLIPLKNRPWSQYMLMYANDEDRIARIITPGANILARRVRVVPHFSINLNNALVYYQCGFQAEAGVNFYARLKETVRLEEDWELGPSIAALDENNNLVDATNRLSTIGNNNIGSNLPDSFRSKIQVRDLDMDKAEHPSVTAFTLYGTLGYCIDAEYPLFVALGGSYEATGINSSLARYTVWAKAGVSL